MRLIYLDEAGKSNPAHEPYFVVAGVIVHADTQWNALETDLWNIVCQYIPEQDQKGFVLHATELFSGGRYFDRDSWPREKRWEILDALVSLISKHRIPIVHGFINRQQLDKSIEEHLDGDTWAAKNRNLLTHGLAFADCARRAQEWMTTYGNSEVAVVIAEDAPRVKRYIKKIHAVLRDPTSEIFQIEDLPISPLSRIIDTVHFAEKHETSILQLADACAFVLKRFLMGKEDTKRFCPAVFASILWPDEFAKQIEALLEKR